LFISSSQRVWRYFRQHHLVSLAAGHIIVIGIFGLVFLNSAFGSTLFGAFARVACASSDQTYVVGGGDTLGAVAARYHTTWQSLARYNNITTPGMIYINQHICIPGSSTIGSPPLAPPLVIPNRGRGNLFPYAQCTWWANQRYYQLHGVYVPWTINANAYQWTMRAYEFHWHVSAQPVAGAIINLQGGVQGAYGLGHVAVVEKVFANGHVIASNMNWGAGYGQVTNVEFSPGPGVTFIYA